MSIDELIKWGTLYSFLVSTGSFLLALKLFLNSRRKITVSLYIGEIKEGRFIYMNKEAENPNFVFLEAVNNKKAPVILVKTGFIMKTGKHTLIDTYYPASPLMRLPKKLNEGEYHRVWMSAQELIPAINNKNIKYGFFEDSLGKRYKTRYKEVKRLYQIFEDL